MTTLENNITKLVEAGIISVDMPKMGGKLIVNGLEFDSRKYYEGRGSKYNKNINHEQVVIKITRKELSKAMRHFKMNLKIRTMRIEAIAKDKGTFGGHHRYTMTKARQLHFPELKEISRIKI